MRKAHVQYLRCPKCKGAVQLRAHVEYDGRVETGTLHCGPCEAEYPIRKFIPRFVPIDNYASSFGLEWMQHARTQYDSYSGHNVSEKRFREETRWPECLEGELVLEIGSGSGRFTEHAARRGAMIVSIDYSYAVEANYGSNGERANVLIVQGDIFQLPVAPRAFNKIFCFGMLQHTPDPQRAFLQLPQYLKPGGNLVVDVYKLVWNTYLWTKYWVRPITKRMPPALLYKLVRVWVNLMWPLALVLRQIPRFGSGLCWRILVCDYSPLGLRGKILKEWAYLDTFDALAPKYDLPQRLDTVQHWFVEGGLTEVEVKYGYNGIEGRGNAPR